MTVATDGQSPGLAGREGDYLNDMQYDTPDGATCQYDHSQIPQALKDLPRWVAWKYEVREGKETKIPFDAKTGNKASTTDPSTWCSFEQACQASANFSGIGFIFNGDGIIGIDQDHVLDAAGYLHPEAAAVVEGLNTYTERSCSGTGLHSICYGALPNDKGRKKILDKQTKRAIEFYSKGRFFVMTGDRWPGTPATIEARHKQVDELVRFYCQPESEHAEQTGGNPVNINDEELIETAMAAANGDKFSALWRGEWKEAKYPSKSEADGALLSMLRFWTGGDKDRAFRLFGQSGLNCDKWAREDYRQSTWALIDHGAVYEPRNAPASKNTEVEDSPNIIEGWTLCATHPPPGDPVIECLFDTSDKVPIIGSSKGRKSFYAMQLSLALASGRRTFLNYKIPKRRKVLYVNLEIKAAHLHRRLYRMAENMGIEPSDLANHFFIVNARSHKLDASRLVAWAKQCGADVVVIDPIYKLIQGDENSAKDVKQLLHVFDLLCERTGAAVLFVHHNPKGYAGDRDTRDRGAGSGVLARDYDAAIYLTDHANGDDLKVMATISRNYPPMKPMSIEWIDGQYYTSDEPPVELTAQRAKSASSKTSIEQADILNKVKTCGPFTMTQFKETLEIMGMRRDMARETPKRLVSEGILSLYKEPVKHGVTWVGLTAQIEQKKQEYEKNSQQSQKTGGQST